MRNASDKRRRIAALKRHHDSPSEQIHLQQVKDLLRRDAQPGHVLKIGGLPTV